MLRAADKGLFVGAQLADLHGGRFRRSPGRALLAPPVIPTLAWYDADDLESLTLDSEGRVTTWGDKSGNGHHAAAAGSPAALTLTTFPGKANVLAQRPAIFFDSVNSHRFTSTAPWGSDSSSSAFVALCVQGLVQYRTIIDSAPFGNQWLFDSATQVVFRHSVGQLGSQGNASITQVRPVVAGQLMASNAVRMYLNLTNEQDAHGSAVSAGNAVIGGGASFFHGWMAEVMLFNTTLSTTVAAQIVEYLMAKWGIT